MVRQLDDLSELEKLALIDMSYSRINTYEMCAANYFYSYISKEPRLFGPAAALGNVVHDVLEEHVGYEDLNLPALTISFEQFRPLHDPDSAIPVELIDAAHMMMAEFVDRHEGEEFEVLASEQAFEVVIGRALMRGFIDRVDRTAQGIKITDYKTSKYEEKSAATNLQLIIYVLASGLQYPDVDHFLAELYYLRSGHQKAHLFHRSDFPRLEAMVEDAVNTVLDDHFFHETQTKQYVCSFCDHATSGRCKTGVYRRQRKKKKT